MAGGVTQVVKHLPSKREALSSNARTTKKKNMNCYNLYDIHLCKYIKILKA
jgi:hypothetical protein